MKTNNWKLRAGLTGFTLVEVLITVAIIGILFAITSAVYGAAEARSRDQQRLSNLDTINNALEQYHLDNHSYPLESQAQNNNIFAARFQLESIEGCAVSGPPGKTYVAPNYLPSIPQDPQYSFSCNGNQFGQYLYVANVPPPGGTTTPVQSFYLMARMEKTANMSPANTAANLQASSFGTSYWGTIIYGQNSTLVFCDAGTSDQTTCTHNYFKANNPN